MQEVDRECSFFH